MKINKEQIIIYSALCISPFFCFITSFYFIFKRKVFSVFALSLSITMMFIFYPLMYDTIANFNVYYGNVVTDFTQISNDLYINLATILKDKFGLGFIYFYAIGVFVIFNIKLKILNIGLNNKSSIQAYYIYLFIFVCSIYYRDIADLNRTYLSLSLSLFGIYFIFIRDRVNILLGCFFLFLSVGIHSFGFIVIFLILISKNVNVKRYQLFIILLSVLFCFFSKSIFLFIADHVDFFKPLRFYITSETWGRNTLTIDKIFLKVLDVAIMATCIFYFKNNTNNIIYKMLYFIFIIAICVFFYQTFFERITVLFYIFLPLLFTLQSKLNIKILIFLVGLILVRFLFYNFFLYGHAFYNSDIVLNKNDINGNILKSFYYPSIMYFYDIGNSDVYINSHYFWGYKLTK